MKIGDYVGRVNYETMGEIKLIKIIDIENRTGRLGNTYKILVLDDNGVDVRVIMYPDSQWNNSINSCYYRYYMNLNEFKKDIIEPLLQNLNYVKDMISNENNL